MLHCEVNMQKLICLVLLLLLVTTLSGCTTTEKGTVLGGLGGAGIGAIVGSQSGHAAGGAAIGGVGGAVAGAIIGNQME